MNIFRELNIALDKSQGIYSVECLQQGWGKMAFCKDIMGDAGIPCGDKVYETGIATHAPSRIRITLQKPAKSFHALCGHLMDWTMKPLKTAPDMIFSVDADGKTLFSTGTLKFRETRTVNVAIPEGTLSFDLVVEGAYVDTHAAWAETRIEFSDGSVEDPSAAPRQFAFYADCPVAFEYEGKSSCDLFLKNPPEFLREMVEAGERVTMRWSCDSLVMKTVITLYKDLPVAEWHTEFSNPSQQRSGRLRNVSVLSSELLAPRQLVRRHGSFHDPVYGGDEIAFKDSYAPVTAHPSESCWTFGSVGGRPTDKWLPCFDFEDSQADIRFVIGWAGQWIARIKNEFGRFKLTAGMEDLDTVLEPGETITQPSVFMLYAKGVKEPGAANIWREFVLKHVMADIPADAPVSISSWGGLGEPAHLQLLDNIEKHKIPHDVFWIDAGWYAPKNSASSDTTWVYTVGDWKFDNDNYPNEMKNISQRVRANGRKFLLWFEPERVMRSSEIALKHPEYMIFLEGIPGALLDLGNPNAWQWCRDTIGRIIEDNGIEWYREDFNLEPLAFWRSKDAPDRKGMTEVRFVEGLYRFWKDLRESYPALRIDNCSSGGRRLDIEMIRYSFPLWYSDMQCYSPCNPELTLVQTAGLAHYLPIFGGSGGNEKGQDTYGFRANHSLAFCVHYEGTDNPSQEELESIEWLKKMLRQQASIRDLFAENFYELSAPVRAMESGAWIILEYARRDASKSVILAFRPAESEVAKYQLRVKGLCPEANYRMYDMDGMLTEKISSGKELMEKGIDVELLEQRSSMVILLEKEGTF